MEKEKAPKIDVDNHIVNQLLQNKYPNLNTGKETQTAISIINLLYEADLSIGMAGWILDLCKESLQFASLSLPKEKVI